MINDACTCLRRFPESSSGSEFYRNLVSGTDMVNDDDRKWKHFLNPKIPQRSGKMKKNELYSFDAQFFGIHGQQAKVYLTTFIPKNLSNLSNG